jgi:sugar/nucleoside kinase (ribokinase family)
MAPVPPRVTVIGDLVEDVVVWRRGAVTPGTDNPSTVHRSRGGSAANVAAAVAAARTPVRFIGRVGDDAVGDRLVAELGGAGVEVCVQRGGRTGCVVVLVDPDGERTMFPDRAAAAELGPVDHAMLDGTAVLHVPLYGFLDPAAAGHVLDAVAHATSTGAQLSLDLSATSAIVELTPERVRGLVDDLRPALVFANAAEFDAAGLAALRPQAGGRFVVKDGPRPARLVAADGSVELVEPERVDGVRDTTGAGDRFAGAFLASWAAGASPRACCEAGHRAAARTLGEPGATV